MSDVTANCLICGEQHPDVNHQAAGCPAMKAAQASDVRPRNVPPDVYTGYLNAREAMRANSPGAAVRGLRRLLGALAQEQGAQPDDVFSEQIAKLCAKGIIGARIRNTLLKQALSDSMEATQAWALMSIAEHAFYRLYIAKAGD